MKSTPFSRAIGGIAAATMLLPVLVGQQNIATGPNDRPADTYLAAEHANVSCSLPLQGNRLSTKYAPVLFGANAPTLANFVTVVVVNNTDPTLNLVVDIDYYDNNGTVLSTLNSVFIAPEDSYVGVAPLSGTTVGTVRVRTNAQTQATTFVGATVYYANTVVNPLNPKASIQASDYLASMQPLQGLQRAETTLHFGPIPVHAFSPNSPLDLVNGIFGFITLINPAIAPNNVQITLSNGNGFVQALPPVAIAAGGAAIDTTAFNRALGIFTNGLPGDDEDLFITVTSLDNRPLIGELLMMDLASNQNFGDGELSNVGGRVRLASTMAGYVATSTAVSPEVTVQLNDIQSAIGISRVAGGALVPATVTYYDRDGNVLGSDVTPPLGPTRSVVIGPGMAASPNFPTGGVFGGWARVTTPAGALIGWTMRGSENAAHPHRAYAELLWGNGGSEHAFGWLSGGLRRSIAPLAFELDDLNPDPGYIAFVNDSTANLGVWELRFWEMVTPGLSGLQAFAGLGLNRTALTYEDPIITTPAQLHFGQTSVTNVGVKGIATIGGELGIRLGLEVPSYPGPGDLVRPPM
ncbi:MAG: hypothetical protein AB7I19_20175 [Planctomycetota bacterium]